MSLKRMSFSRSLLPAILLTALLLAIAKPALYFILGHSDSTSNLNISYGIPTQWFKNSDDPRRPGVKVAEGSIGLDFLNVDTYIRCSGFGPNIYSDECWGDPLGRPYTYPPLLTLMFAWVLLVSTAKAVALWSLTLLLLIFGCVWWWGTHTTKFSSNREMPACSPIIFALILSCSYPSVFSFERGNSDICVLVLISALTICISRKFWFLCGLLSSVVFFMKIYPIFVVIAFQLTAFWILAKKNS